MTDDSGAGETAPVPQPEVTASVNADSSPVDPPASDTTNVIVQVEVPSPNATGETANETVVETEGVAPETEAAVADAEIETPTLATDTGDAVETPENTELESIAIERERLQNESLELDNERKEIENEEMRADAEAREDDHVQEVGVSTDGRSIEVTDAKGSREDGSAEKRAAAITAESGEATGNDSAERKTGTGHSSSGRNRTDRSGGRFKRGR